MRVTIEMKADQCPQCHAARVFVADVTPTGYSAGAEIDHSLLCPSRFCEHGKRQSGPFQLQEECEPCEKQREADREHPDNCQCIECLG